MNTPKPLPNFRLKLFKRLFLLLTLNKNYPKLPMNLKIVLILILLSYMTWYLKMLVLVPLNYSFNPKDPMFFKPLSMILL